MLIKLRIAHFRDIIWIIVLFAVYTKTSVAQKSPFSQLEVSFTGHQNMPNSDVFYDFFGTGFGGGLSMRTPFYIGNANLGLQWHKYRKNLVTVPKMTAMFMHVGWGYPLSLGMLEIEPSVRLGNYRMMFEVENAFRSELDESEFTTAIHARATMTLGGGASLHIEASRLTVYTYNRLYFNYLGAGISYTFQTGSKFQEVMKQ